MMTEKQANLEVKDFEDLLVDKLFHKKEYVTKLGIWYDGYHEGFKAGVEYMAAQGETVQQETSNDEK